MLKFARFLLLIILYPEATTAQINFSPNIAYQQYKVTDDSSRICCLSIGLLSNVDSLRGFQLGLVESTTRKDMRGVNIGGLWCSGRSNVHGLQLGGLINGVGEKMSGVQIATVANLAASTNGIQLAALGNASATRFRGLQISGVSNVAVGVEKGIQLSALVNVSSGVVRGAQIGSYNYADTLNGSQIGLINVALTHPRGVQVGIFNYTRDTIANKIGLVNINPRTRIDLLLSYGSASRLNTALRFRNRSTYSMVGFGLHYVGFDDAFSGTVFYRLGQYFPISKRWTLSGDLGFWHIENFEKNTRDKPQRLYSLQAHANADYQLSPMVGAFVSVGYGKTRYYGSNNKYKQGFLGSIGFTFKYDWKSNKQPLIEKALRRRTPVDSLKAFAYDAPWWQEKKKYWLGVAEAAGINVLVHSFDRFILNEDFAKVNFKTIGANFKNAFVWDNDQFSTNLFAHPYHGNLYFNAARSNGLNFWESVPYTFGGSLMWELIGEVEPPAINDLIATSFGGVCIGEITHRISALILNDRTRGFRRFLREFAATIINPMHGFNRLVSGEATRIHSDYYLYHDYARFPVEFNITIGSRYLADDGGLFRGEHNPYINMFLDYGDLFNEDENKPYDYFSANITIGLSANQPIINGMHLLGKLWSVPVYTGKHFDTEFGIFHHFNYYDSKQVKDGTSLTPYRISEAAAFGPGLIYRFQNVGNLKHLEQRLFMDAILLGGTKSDYYNVIDRDYNMGSGYSFKSNTIMEFARLGKFLLNLDYYRIFTWKGYENKDLEKIDPLFVNAQGDRGNAQLLVINPRMIFRLRGNLGIELSGSYFVRDTQYKFYDNVHTRTFELNGGLIYRF
ncbi:UNVERIFIED_CONTAM: DUF3943 domain-containing protein [Prevotella sp. 15_C9]